MELNERELGIVLSALHQKKEYTSETDALTGKINTRLENGQEFFNIASLSRDDLTEIAGQRDAKTGETLPEIQETIDKLTDNQMKWIAKKMADGFLNCCYWTLLEELFNKVKGENKK